MASRAGFAIPQLSQAEKQSFRAGIVIFLLFAVIVIGLHPLRPIGPRLLTGEGDPAREAAYLFLLFFSIIALRVFDDLRNFQPLPLSLALLMGWCWLSLSWSNVPDIGLRRLALTTMLIWLIFVAVQKAGFDMTVRMMRAVLLIALAASYVAVTLNLPSAIHRAPDPLDPRLVGDWRGIFGQKNIAGQNCAVAIIFLMFFPGGWPARLRLVLAIAAAYFLYHTQSKTSMGMLAISLVCGWIYSAIGTRVRPMLIFIAITAAAVIGYVVYSFLTAAYYSPDALTGRVQIWPALFDYCKDHLWLGSGFGSFWNVGTASPIYIYSLNWVSTVANGHNGYIDLMVGLGLPGFVMAIFALIVTPAWNLLSSTQISRGNGAFLLACLIFCVGHNITESSILDRDVYVGMMLIFTVVLTQVETRGGRTPVRRRSPVLKSASAFAISRPD